MRRTWKPVPMKLWPDFMSAVGAHNRAVPLPVCPSCRVRQLSIYGHRFAVTGGTRGTIWVWCSTCLLWTHASRVEVPDSLAISDVFRSLSDREFQKLESTGLLDALENLPKEPPR